MRPPPYAAKYIHATHWRIVIFPADAQGGADHARDRHANGADGRPDAAPGGRPSFGARGHLAARILFSGDELADIIAFVHNDAAQHGFSEADLTPVARKMMHHEHGAHGAGPKAHAEGLGHKHMMGQGPGGAPAHTD